MGGKDEITMSDPFIHDDNLVAAALRQNWDHARHVETQRLYLLAIYVAIAAALGYVAIHGGDPYLRLGATFLALCVTLIVWGIARKLGRAFANQVRHADRCARRLKSSTASKPAQAPSKSTEKSLCRFPSRNSQATGKTCSEEDFRRSASAKG